MPWPPMLVLRLHVGGHANATFAKAEHKNTAQNWLPAYKADAVPAHSGQWTRLTLHKYLGTKKSPPQHVRLPPPETVIMLDPTTRNHGTQ